MILQVQLRWKLEVGAVDLLPKLELIAVTPRICN